MMNNTPISISEHNLNEASAHGLRNALLYLISQHTLSVWRMTECGVGLEMVAPHRTFLLLDENGERWQGLYRAEFSAPLSLKVQFEDCLIPAFFPFALHPLEILASESEIFTRFDLDTLSTSPHKTLWGERSNDNSWQKTS